MHTRKAVLATLAVAAVLNATTATAQDYPTRPITLVVPFSAGGPSDTLIRIVVDRMRASLGQPVIVANVGGAAGRIGTAQVVHAAPDGYTLAQGSFNTHVVNSVIFKLKYDVVTDFEPVALLAHTPQLIVARKTMPANDLKELITWLKANPDKASQGTTGVGSTSHLAGTIFQKATGTRFQFVPYRGTAMPDLVAGNIDLMIDQTSNALVQVQSGAIKAYAVASKTRLAQAPEVPTTDEAGLPGFYLSNWYAVWAPKGTPEPIIRKLNAAVVHALADPAVRQRLADLHLEIYPRDQQTPTALAAFQKAEIDKWWPIVRDAEITGE